MYQYFFRRLFADRRQSRQRQCCPRLSCPALLVFGTYPRLGFHDDAPHPSNALRSLALLKAIEDLTKQFARLLVSSAFATRNGPDTSDVWGPSLCSFMLVYRDRATRGASGWEVPFHLLGISNSTATFLLLDGPKPFRITHIKSFIIPLPSILSPTDASSEDIVYLLLLLPFLPLGYFLTTKSTLTSMLIRSSRRVRLTPYSPPALLRPLCSAIQAH